MHNQVDILGTEAVAAGQMHPHLLDQITGVVGDVAAHSAHQVELVVGVGDLPVAARLAETDFLRQTKFRQQRQRSIDAG